MNESPWIGNLIKKFQAPQLSRNEKVDVTIIGGGVSGVLSAFYILNNTDYSVCIIEANQCGYGASGHNAGMMITFVENINEISTNSKYSKEEIENTLCSLKNSWQEFHKLRKILPTIDTYFTQVEGNFAYEDVHSLIDTYSKFLKMKEYGLDLEGKFYISDEVEIDTNLYHAERIKQHEIDKLYPNCKYKVIGYSTMPNIGVMNSSQLVQDILEYLASNYPERFKVYEKSPVKEIVNESDRNISVALDHYIESEFVIVCTNGYKVPNIVGRSIFEEVRTQGVVNYMMGKYVDDIDPIAYSFYKTGDGVEGDVDYIYGTVRKMKDKNLMTFGNARDVLIKNFEYNSESDAEEKIREELKSQSDKYFENLNIIEPQYIWHGLMGYTNSRNRKVGEFPHKSKIIYNLGCNGIGIMPAIASGKIISEYFRSGEMLSTIWKLP